MIHADRVVLKISVILLLHCSQVNLIKTNGGNAFTAHLRVNTVNNTVSISQRSKKESNISTTQLLANDKYSDISRSWMNYSNSHVNNVKAIPVNNLEIEPDRAYEGSLNQTESPVLQDFHFSTTHYVFSENTTILPFFNLDKNRNSFYSTGLLEPLNIGPGKMKSVKTVPSKHNDINSGLALLHYTKSGALNDVTINGQPLNMSKINKVLDQLNNSQYRNNLLHWFNTQYSHGHDKLQDNEVRKKENALNQLRDDRILQRKSMLNSKSKRINNFETSSLEYINKQPCAFKDGMYLNVCGKCVKVVDNRESRVDGCGICDGNNQCGACSDMPGTLLDSCGQCLKPADERWNNCTKSIDMLPKVIDLAMIKGTGSVIFKGVGLDETNLPDLFCSIYGGNEHIHLNVTGISVKNEKIFITFELLQNSEGDFKVFCNSSNEDAVLGEHALTIINSNSLSVIMMTPDSVNLGDSVQLSLSVKGVATLAEIMCYINDSNNTLIASLLTSKIQGNSLVSNITCPAYTPRCADNFFVGVAYSYYAISQQKNAKTKMLAVKANAPILKSISFSSDLRYISIEFDDNIAGPMLCHSLFTKQTYILLGFGPICTYSANFLWIMLGKTPTIRSTDEITFIPGLIRSACGNPNNAPAFTGQPQHKLIGNTHFEIPKPVYKMVGPNLVCPGEKFDPHKLRSLASQQKSSNETTNSSIEFLVRTGGSEEIHYNWSVRFRFEREDPQMEPNIRQRRNLLVWLSVRELEKSFRNFDIRDRINVNNSLLIPNVKYVLAVVGRNQLGEIGDQINMTFQLANSSKISDEPIQMIISGPSRINIETDTLFEAKLIASCTNNQLPINIKYFWTLENDTTTMDMLAQIGPKLVIPGGMLKSNKHYRVTSKLVTTDNTSSTLVNNSWHVETFLPEFNIDIGVSNLVVGTGQNLELWASTDLVDFPTNNIEFMWFCEYNGTKCYAPDPNITELEELYKNEFRKKVLKLKPGSLVVGQYRFKVKALVKDENVTVISRPTIVNVIAGEPPKIDILQYPTRLVNPENGLLILARVSNLSPGCQLSWEVERETGLEYFNINTLDGLNSTIIVPYDAEVKSLEFPLTIRGRMVRDANREESTTVLIEGANYAVSLSVHCNAERHSSAITKFHTAILPKLEKLDVSPLGGIALMTEFHFTSDRAYAPQQDHPLIYSFGFKPSKEKLQFFYSSSDWLAAKTFLPSVSSQITIVETFLKVCNVKKVCVVKQGSSIHTQPPKTVSPEILHTLGTEYSRLLSGQEYNEALGVAVSSLKTLQTLPDNKYAYNNVSKHIESAILEQIDIALSNVEKNNPSTVKPALTLLDTITATIQYIPQSDSVLTNLVALKKKIINTLKESGNSTIEVRSLVQEKSNKIFKKPEISSLLWKARVRRQVELPSLREEVLTFDMVKTLLEASEIAILNFTMQENAVSETKELLNNINYYITSLCDQTSEGKLLYIGTKIAKISVRHIHLDVTYNEELVMPSCTSDCDISRAYVKLGKKLADAYQSYHQSENICFANSIFPSDYLSLVYSSDNITSLDQSRWSNIYNLKLLTYSDLEPKNDEKPICVEMKIPIKNWTLPNEFKLECFVWVMEKGEWLPNICKMADVGGNEFVGCECPINHYISVFAVNHTKTNNEQPEFDSTDRVTHKYEATENLQAEETKVEHTTKPDWELISLSYHKISFKIEEDFNRIVGKQSLEFTETVKAQLMDHLKMPSEMFKSISISPGSILVTMQLVNSASLSVNDILPVLVRLLNYGNLELVGLDGRKLNVPPQLLQITEKQTADNDDSYEALIATTIGFAICTVIFLSVIMITVLMKRNRDRFSKEIDKSLDDINIPKYRQLYFEQSIDGTETSLSQYRQPVQTKRFTGSGSSRDEEDSGISIITEMVKKRTENGSITTEHVQSVRTETSSLPGSASNGNYT